jgi:Uma2 family endonuclease
MSTRPPAFLTEAEYLELERRAETKSEYYHGQMFAMSGGSPTHGEIILNVGSEFRQQLRGKGCHVYSSDVRLRVTPAGLYTYPDVMVVCGDAQFVDDQRDTIMNPVVLVEVLSPSTQVYDQTQKFQLYRSLPSLTDYLIIAQDRPYIEQHTRQPENRWLLSEFKELDQSVPLASIGCTLKLAEVYCMVDWTA